MTLSPEQVKLVKEAVENSLKGVSAVLRMGGIGPAIGQHLETRQSELLALSLQLDNASSIILEP